MAAANSRPPGLSTRAASCSARARSLGVGQVIQRAEQEDDVRGFSRHVQGAGVAHSAGGERPLGRGAAPPRFRHQPRHRIEQVDRIARLGEPEGIGSGGSTNVHDGTRRWRRKALNQLPGARLLELERPLLEPSFLGCSLVVVG